MALVTITRSLGCGEAGIAQRVARSLQVKLYDDFELKESALYMGIRSEMKEVRAEATIMPSDGD